MPWVGWVVTAKLSGWVLLVVSGLVPVSVIGVAANVVAAMFCCCVTGRCGTAVVLVGTVIEIRWLW